MMENNAELHKKLMADQREAKQLISEFQTKIKELEERSITKYGALLLQVYAPVEVQLRGKNDTFVDPETDTEMYNYYLSDIKIVPLTLAHNGRLKK